MTVTYMKIDNYDTTSDAFTFTVNPQTLDDQFANNYDVKNIIYQRYHMFYGLGGIDPKQVVLTGYFYGADKLTDYATLARHWSETYKIKKLYFQSDRFYIGFGKNIKMTQTGGRTNFTDYVATFQTFLGILLGDSAKTSGTNDGNVPTYVTTITGHYSGSGNVVLTDGYGTTVTFHAADIASYPYWKYSMVKLVNAGSNIYYSEWGYCERSSDGSTYVPVGVSKNPSVLLLQLDVGANITTVTTTNSTSVSKVFRDGWIV